MATKTVLQHRNPAHAEYELDDGKAAAALVPIHQIQNLVLPDEFPDKHEDLTGEIRMTRGELKELATDITTNGLDDDVILKRLASGIYWRIDGRHRVAAHVEAGFDTVPARFRDDYDEKEVAMRTILANELRTDLTPFQQALDWQNAIDAGVEAKEIAARMGKSPSTVSKRLALLAVPPAIARLAPKFLPFEDVPWWKPLQGWDELAEKVAAAVRKSGNPVTQYGRRDLLVRQLGVGADSLGAAPLDQGWVAKVAKLNSWELYGFADETYRKKVLKLEHVVFGTKASPDLVLVRDVAAAKELALEATQKLRDKKAKEDEQRKKNNQKHAKERQKAEALQAATSARAARLIGERIAPIKKLDDELTVALARSFLREFGWGSDYVEGPIVDVAVQILGKHAEVLKIEPDAPVVEISIEIFDELLGRSKTAAWQYLALVVAEAGRTESGEFGQAMHELFAGETREATEQAAEKEVKA